MINCCLLRNFSTATALLTAKQLKYLNRFTSVNEADLFLKKNYLVKNNWDKETRNHREILRVVETPLRINYTHTV